MGCVNMVLWDFLVSLVIPGLVGGGVAWAVFAYLGQKFIEQRLSKDIKRFESELSQKTEALKVQLSIYAHEQNIVATRIDGQRADAIKLVYKAISEWKIPTEKLVGKCPMLDPDPEFEETEWGYYLDWVRKSNVAGRNLISVLEGQAIYFDEDLYNKLLTGIICFSDTVEIIATHVDVGLTVGIDYEDLVPEVMKLREELVPIYNEKFLPLFQEIITDFRFVLGSMRK